MIFKVYTLYSGSSGNAVFVRIGDVRLLLDAGRSFRCLSGALESIGESVASLCAVFVSHEHSDHTAALKLLSRRHPVPIYLAQEVANAPCFCGTHADSQAMRDLLHPIAPDTPICFYDAANHPLCRVTAFSLPHDSAACFGYRIETPVATVAVATDIGYPTKGLMTHLQGCDCVILEANYDTQRLNDGPYPLALKQRITSSGGHLSNDESAQCCVALAKQGVKRILLAHLSDQNNTPLLAYKTVWCALQQQGLQDGCLLSVAQRYEPTCLYDSTLSDSEAKEDTALAQH